MSSASASSSVNDRRFRRFRLAGSEGAEESTRVVEELPRLEQTSSSKHAALNLILGKAVYLFVVSGFVPSESVTSSALGWVVIACLRRFDAVGAFPSFSESGAGDNDGGGEARAARFVVRFWGGGIEGTAASRSSPLASSRMVGSFRFLALETAEDGRGGDAGGASTAWEGLDPTDFSFLGIGITLRYVIEIRVVRSSEERLLLETYNGSSSSSEESGIMTAFRLFVEPVAFDFRATGFGACSLSALTFKSDVTEGAVLPVLVLLIAVVAVFDRIEATSGFSGFVGGTSFSIALSARILALAIVIERGISSESDSDVGITMVFVGALDRAFRDGASFLGGSAS